MHFRIIKNIIEAFLLIESVMKSKDFIILQYNRKCICNLRILRQPVVLKNKQFRYVSSITHAQTASRFQKLLCDFFFYKNTCFLLLMDFKHNKHFHMWQAINNKTTENTRINIQFLRNYTKIFLIFILLHFLFLLL